MLQVTRDDTGDVKLWKVEQKHGDDTVTTIWLDEADRKILIDALAR